MSQVISSEQNKVYKDLINLHSSSGIKKQKQFLVFGEKVVREYLKNQHQDIRLILSESSSSSIEAETLFEETNSRDLAKTVLKNELFKNVDLFNTKFPILQCQLPEIEPWDQTSLAKEPSLICALGEPSNLGAVMRCADSFGVKNLILTEEASFPFHPKSIRASSGSFQRITFFKGPSIHSLTTPVIALDMKGEDLGTFAWPKEFFLLVGEEGQGIPPSIPSQRVSIAMNPKTESLNAAVSMGIALYDFRLKHPLKP